MTTPVLHKPDRKPDWQDTHTGPVATRHSSARAAFEHAFNAQPRWVGWAMKARNIIVKPLGLITEPVDAPEGAAMLTHMPVAIEQDNEFETGITDRHLTFTIHTVLRGDVVDVTTKIWFNHWLGRAYLCIVMIPHKIILRSTLRAIAKA